MLTLLRQYNATVFSPHRGKTADSEACQVARDNFHGYYGPWLQIPPTVPRSPPFADSGLQA